VTISFFECSGFPGTMPTTVLFNACGFFFWPLGTFNFERVRVCCRAGCVLLRLERCALAGEFLCVLRFNKRFEVIQTGCPEGAVLLQPRIDRAKRLGIQMVEAVPAFAVLVYQVCAPEQTQVFRNRRPRDRKRLRDLPSRLAPVAKQVEHRTPGRIGECAERGLRRICNRSVPHNV
jgi:hypothetical protein